MTCQDVWFDSTMTWGYLLHLCCVVDGSRCRIGRDDSYERFVEVPEIEVHSAPA